MPLIIVLLHVVDVVLMNALLSCDATLQVSKSDEYPWSVLKPDVFAAIMDHYTSGVQR